MAKHFRVISCLNNFQTSFPVSPLVESITQSMLNPPQGKSAYKWLTYSTISCGKRKHFNIEKTIDIRFKEYIKYYIYKIPTICTLRGQERNRKSIGTCFCCLHLTAHCIRVSVCNQTPLSDFWCFHKLNS